MTTDKITEFEKIVKQQSFDHSNDVYRAFEVLLEKAQSAGFAVDVFEDAGQTCIRVVKQGEVRIAASLPGVTKSLLFAQQVETYLNKHIEIARRQGFPITFRVLADGTAEAAVLKLGSN